MNELAKTFQQWLTEEGRALKTIESYVGDIQGFQQYLIEKAADGSQPLSLCAVQAITSNTFWIRILQFRPSIKRSTA